MPMIEIFKEEEITPESATLAPDFVKRIREAFVNEILDQPSSYNNDVVHISRLFSNSTIRYKDSRNRFVRIRTPPSFVKAAQQAIDNADSEYYIHLFFTIDHWYFGDDWNPMKFSQVTLREPQIAAAPMANPNPNQDQATAMQAIANQMERLGERLDAQLPGNNPTGNNPTQQANQGVQNPNQIGTANTGNPTFYNRANMPQQVLVRYEKQKNRDIFSEDNMAPFIFPAPTQADPSATRSGNYFMDGPIIVTRDGTLFDLTNNDQTSKSNSRDKLFTSAFPKLTGERPEQIRQWYNMVLRHCIRQNIYLHPYFLFRMEANNIQGFTIGDLDIDDLPGKYEFSVGKWSNLIYSALVSDKVIPESCTRVKATMQAYKGADGYENIYAIISPTHPNHIEYPMEMVMHCPVQQPGESLEYFYFRYTDYLELKAFLYNYQIDFNHKREIEVFICALLDAASLKRKTNLERNSNSPEILAKYKRGALLRTLQLYSDEIIKARDSAKARRPTSRFIPPRNSTKRYGRPRELPAIKGSTVGSSLTSKTLNLMDFLERPKFDEDDAEGEKWFGHYCAAINNISAQPKLFDTSKECLVCRKTGHSFDKCPILNDIPSLRQHRISVAQLIKRIQDRDRTTLENTASISQLATEPTNSVTWQDDDDYEPDIDYYDDDQDFYQG